MMRFPSRSAVALVVLGTLLVACGDDDDPVAVDSPCDDANTTCLTLQLTTADMTYFNNYDPLGDRTGHTLHFDASSAVLSDYGPGRRVFVTVTFNPPIEVRYDHSGQSFRFHAGSTGGIDGSVNPTFSALITDWPYMNAEAACMRESVTGAPRFGLFADFDPLTPGDELNSVSFSLTIPETYTNGMPVLAGDLVNITIEVGTLLDGSSEGNPPAWPKGHPLP
jgi:hypothetical protein